MAQTPVDIEITGRTVPDYGPLGEMARRLRDAMRNDTEYHLEWHDLARAIESQYKDVARVVEILDYENTDDSFGDGMHITVDTRMGSVHLYIPVR